MNITIEMQYSTFTYRPVAVRSPFSIDYVFGLNEVKSDSYVSICEPQSGIRVSSVHCTVHIQYCILYNVLITIGIDDSNVGGPVSNWARGGGADGGGGQSLFDEPAFRSEGGHMYCTVD